MNQLRSTILAQQQKIASKSRFGLFSQPPPLAVGDDGAYKKTLHSKGQDGKPITKARNLLAGSNRSGQGKKGYFGVPDSIYQGDKYEDPFKIEIKYDKQMHTRSSYHQTQFKPASAYKVLSKSAYQYVQQKPLQQKKRKLNQNGRVWTQPKNVTTNSISKIERQFMKNPEHVIDPYQRKNDQAKKDKQIWRSKLPEASWKLATNSLHIFNRDKIVYGIDQTAKQIIAKKQEPKKLIMKTVQHQAAFTPAVKSVTDTIGKYPKAMSAQSLQSLRVPPNSGKKQQQNWRPNNGIGKSKPTPSISLNRKNIHIPRYK